MKQLLTAFLIVSSFAFAQHDESEKKYFAGYVALSQALVKDDFASVRTLANENRASVDEWLKEELEVSWRKNLEQSSIGLQALASAKEDKDFRRAFSDYSEGVVRYIKAVGKTANWQLFFCPMVEEGFAYWVQVPGEKIQNPYMGQVMPKCGFKKKWESLPER